MNDRLERLAAVVRADVLIRLRRPSTAVIFLLLSIVPYKWIPEVSTGRTLIEIGGHRALYNSAAIGMGTAVLATFFIGLAGFYVISNALRRDVLTRCGYVIASTTMRGSEYIAGKFAGNVAFLTLFVSGYMAVAMIMVIVRGEAPLEPLVFAKQYLLLLPPPIVFVSAIALLFECTPLLRTKLGDVVYFFVWIGLMGSVTAMVDNGVARSWTPYLDISGLGFMLQQTKIFYHAKSLAIGASRFDPAKPPFVFEGFRADSLQWLVPRIVATLWPMALLLPARLFFHRFDPARVRAVPNEQTRRTWLGRFNLLANPFARLAGQLGRAAAAIPGLPHLLRAAIIDALASLSAFPLTMVAMLGIAIAATTVPEQALFAAVLPLAFAACALALADIACREKRAGTTALVYAAPTLRTHFVGWKFASTLLVAAAFLAIPVAKAIALRPASAASLLIGVLFTAAAATTLGILSANPKTFIVAFLTFWYIALSDHGRTPSLDFGGWYAKATPSITLTYAAFAAGLLLLAQLFHTWELRRSW